MNLRSRLRLRRTAVMAFVLVASFAGAAVAQEHRRMDPDQRERLRRELREHDAQRAERAPAEGARQQAGAAGESARLSGAERERLRQQLRDARARELSGSHGRGQRFAEPRRR